VNVAVIVAEPAPATVAVDDEIEITDVSDEEYENEPANELPVTPVTVGAEIVYEASP
jgi:hypothetical protein